MTLCRMTPPEPPAGPPTGDEKVSLRLRPSPKVQESQRSSAIRSRTQREVVPCVQRGRPYGDEGGTSGYRTASDAF
jgi:hypothetical protein